MDLILVTSIGALLVVMASQLFVIALKHYYKFQATLDFYYKLDLSLELLKLDLSRTVPKNSLDFSNLIGYEEPSNTLSSNLIQVPYVIEKCGFFEWDSDRLGSPMYRFKSENDAPIFNNDFVKLKLDPKSLDPDLIWVVTEENGLYSFNTDRTYSTESGVLHFRKISNQYSLKEIKKIRNINHLHFRIAACTVSHYKYFLKNKALMRENTLVVHPDKANPNTLLEPIFAWQISYPKDLIKIDLEYPKKSLISKKTESNLRCSSFFIKLP
ncbi:MAG: hypothetical protein ACKOAD_08545 [Gammaproteobacteria bacterium]